MSIRLGDAWDGAALGYDAWKTCVPEYHDCEDESEFFCDACEDIGWLHCCDSGHAMVIPCTECSSELTVNDLE